MSAEDFAGMSEFFREQSKIRRAGNRQSSLQILQVKGYDVAVKNDGAHLIVTHAGIVADLWPGTGKYKLRTSERYKRGVFNLIKELERAK